MYITMNTFSSTYVCVVSDITGSMLLIYTAYFNDIVVGGVCCRVETEAMVKKLYIMTLGCLAAYRRLGVGMCIMTMILEILYVCVICTG